MHLTKLPILGAMAVAAFGFGGQQAIAADASLFAYNVDYNGAVKMKYEGLTAECDNTLGLDGAGGNNCFGGDDVNANGAQFGPGDTPGNAGSVFNETTYGFGRITAIDSDDGNNTSLWNPLTDTQGAELVYFIYGIADLKINSIGGGQFDIFNVGCTGAGCDGKIHIDFYLIDSGDWPTFNGLNASARTAGANNAAETAAGFQTLAGLTDLASADLLFKMELDNRDPDNADPNAAAATLSQTVNGTALPADGEGSFLSDCVAGPACVGVNNVNMNNNGQGPAGHPNINDFFGQFTLTAATGTPLANGWGGSIDDPIRTDNTSVPAPGVLLLFGAGLAGLAGAARRKARRG